MGATHIAQETRECEQVIHAVSRSSVLIMGTTRSLSSPSQSSLSVGSLWIGSLLRALWAVIFCLCALSVSSHSFSVFFLRISQYFWSSDDGFISHFL